MQPFQYVARPPERSKVKPVVKPQAGAMAKAAIRAAPSSVPHRAIGILVVM